VDVGLQLVASKLRLAWHARVPRRRTHASDALASRRLVVLQAVFRECAIVDPVRGLLFQHAFLENAQHVGSADAVFLARAWDAYYRAVVGGYRRRAAVAKLLDQLDAMAAELRTPYSEATALLIRGACAIAHADFPSAARAAARASSIFREHCPGTSWEVTFCGFVRDPAVENVGPISEIGREAPRTVRQANERVDQLTDALRSASMSVALLAADKPAEAREFLSQRLERLEVRMDMQSFALTLRLIDVGLYACDGQAAWQVLERSWPEYRRSGYDRSDTLAMMYRMRRARGALRLGASRPQPRLHAIVEDQARRLTALRRPDAETIAETLRAGLAFQRGQLVPARRHLQQAIDGCERLGATIAALCVRLQLGRITPGHAGERSWADAASALREQGVCRPEAWAELYATGFIPDADR
jgi:hypothetical protein